MSYLEELNEVQRKIVTDTEGYFLVLAGAGSGKTRVLTYRIAYLLKELGVSPLNILAITFTNKATREMKERVERISENAGRVWVSTFHSFCVRVLRANADRLGFTSDFTIYTDKESMDVIYEILGGNSKDNSSKAKNLRYHISNCKNVDGDAVRYADNHVLDDAKFFVEAYAKYGAILKQNNALDFDDLLLATLYLFQNYPDVLAKYAERFRYILVDEYQDTNMPQYRIVKLLASHYGNLFVVGDEDQSIYGWRGADIHNILNFKSDFPGAKVYKLEENYRSTQQILDCANKLIAHNKQRMGKNLFTSKTGGDSVKLRDFHGDREECDFVAETIYGLVHRDGYNYSDIAILTRKNSLTRGFEQRLAINGIPFAMYGGVRFYDRKEIKDLLAYLTLLVNPRDDVAFRRICNYPTRGISEATQRVLADFAATNFICMEEAARRVRELDALKEPAKKAVERFVEMIDELRKNVNTVDTVEIIDSVIAASNLIETLKKEKEKKNDSEDRVSNIYSFVAGAKDFMNDNEDAKLSEYLQSLSLYSEMDNSGDGDRVIISTIHMAKGLEFRAVFLVGLENGTFPVMNAVTDPDEMEEERRVAYVAVTRAKEKLYLSWCSERFLFNHYEKYTRSDFISEMLGIPKRTAATKYAQAYRNPYDGGYVAGATSQINSAQKNNYSYQSAQTRPTPTTSSAFSNASSASSFSSSKFSPAASASGDKDLSGFKDGAKVIHPTFGEGVIISVTGDFASIVFQSKGIIKVNLKIAPLKLA